MEGRLLDSVEHIICRTQGNIYEYMARKGYDMESFSDAYLTSVFCKESMDTLYSRFQVREPEECLDFILPEIQDKLNLLPDSQVFDPDVAFWIGWTYRQLYIMTGVNSSELKDKISFSHMCKIYPGMHTINEYHSAEIICENAGISIKPEFFRDPPPKFD